MMGSFLTRALVMVLGYAYPAYECFKTVEKNKPEIDQLRFWCQYWILVALLTIFERVGDTFISWFPMYSEAKLAFFVYLWYPKTKGTTYVYDTFFRPYVSKHETEIDRNLLELRTRAGDIAILYWQKAASYGQTRFFDILQYVASQSQSPSSRPVQRRQQQVPLGPSPRPPAVTAQPQQSNIRPPHILDKRDPQETAQEAGPAPVVSPVVHAQSSSSANRTTGSETISAQKLSSEAGRMRVEVVGSSGSEESSPPPHETIIDEAIHVGRGRLRKTRVAATASAPAVPSR